MKTRKQKLPEFDESDLRRSLALSPRQRLEFLEKLNIMLDRLMPEKNKRIWKTLKGMGW